MISLIYAESKKKVIQMNLFAKQTHRLTALENKLMVTRGEAWWGGIDWEFGIDMYTLIHLK